MQIKNKIKIIAIFFLFIFIAHNRLLAADKLGEIIKIKGRVEIIRNGQFIGKKARIGDALYKGDLVRTKRRSKAVIKLIDGSLIRLDQRSRLEIEGIDRNSGTNLNMPRGKVLFKVAKMRAKGKFKVRTPNAIIGVKGTTFLVNVSVLQTTVMVFEGVVGLVDRFTNKHLVDLTAGKMGKVVTPPKVIKTQSKEKTTEKNQIIKNNKVKTVNTTRNTKTNVSKETPKVKVENFDNKTNVTITEPNVKVETKVDKPVSAPVLPPEVKKVEKQIFDFDGKTCSE